ncbi:MAG: alpha/beta hydrolase fold domain-containing protein [Patiriisocius sp.]|uniref:alpha/beta hydrolase fold domain-containing protein n=1 Tax=Patiriisocius sp. TaxID=2822396 RepID=UPI003EF68401
MKLLSYRIVLFFLFVPAISWGFQSIQKDTSYSIQSAYQKAAKSFDEIDIVTLDSFNNVLIKKDIAYFKTSQRTLQLDAFINTQSQNPAVLLIHGGGWKSGDKSHLASLAQKIASKGYSCFTVEYQLSPEAQYPQGIYDCKESIKFIKLNAKRFHVDANKIAVLGCSSGAQMAALIGTTNNNSKFELPNESFVSAEVQAIIAIDGILAFKHPESQEGKVAAQWLGGSYEEIPEIWEKASALSHTDKNTPPILFINSQYPRFHAGRDDMIAILNENNVYNQTKTIINSPHTFWLFHPWFETIVSYCITFLDTIFK